MWSNCWYVIVQWNIDLMRDLHTIDLVVLAHLRPLSPPNNATSAPWLMNSPPQRKAGSPGFPFTGSTNPSTIFSAPCLTVLTNALFTLGGGESV